MFKKLLPMLVVGTLLVGCGKTGEPRIDASSMESFEKSTEVIANSLKTEEEKRQFGEAIMRVGLMSILEDGAGNGNNANQSMMQKLDKKTAKEVIAEFGEDKSLP